jgi:DNA (cytosine-5)-methyltransferase 1
LDKDKRTPLLNSFARFVQYYKPHYVFIENVPGLQKVKKSGPFDRFCQLLTRMNYSIATEVVAAQNYGVPQTRRRLVLIASRVGEIDIPRPTHGPKVNRPHTTVEEWIAHFPPIEAGEEHAKVPNHRAARLSPLNLARIRSTRPGEDRRSWPDHLKLACHDNYDGHVDVYGRMKWTTPATGLTTRCISLSNGRFGHPEQHRAISVREAAALQTFPDDFIFIGSLNSQAKQVGNAVPTKLAEAFARHILEHWETHNGQI